MIIIKSMVSSGLCLLCESWCGSMSQWCRTNRLQYNSSGVYIMSHYGAFIGSFKIRDQFFPSKKGVNQNSPPWKKPHSMLLGLMKWVIHGIWSVRTSCEDCNCSSSEQMFLPQLKGTLVLPAGQPQAAVRGGWNWTCFTTVCTVLLTSALHYADVVTDCRGCNIILHWTLVSGRLALVWHHEPFFVINVK